MLAARLVLALAATLAILVAPAQALAQEGDRDCADFASQQDAQAFFEANDPDLDPHGLDGDVDYVACESNPCPCSSEAEPDRPPPPPKPRGYRAERAESGDVEAELSYIVRRARFGERYRSKRIRIVRGGDVLINEALPRPPGCNSRCAQFVRPVDFNDRGSLFLRDLDADGEP